MHNQLRQQIDDSETNSTQHPFIKQIDRWEKYSICKIQQIAKQCRTQWIDYSNSFLLKMKNKLNYLVKQVKDLRREKELNEISLKQLEKRLEILLEELN